MPSADEKVASEGQKLIEDSDCDEKGRTNLRLPPFRHSHPIAWFAIVEAKFRLHGVLAQVKSSLVLDALQDLPQKEERQVFKFLRSDPDPKYSDFKQKLIEIFSPSPEKRWASIKLVLSGHSSHLDPSVVMGQLEDAVTLPGKKKELDLVKAVFLESLNPDIRSRIPNAFNLSREELVDTVQKLQDATLSTVTTNTVVKVDSYSSEEINVVSKGKRPHDVCRFHHKWNEKARFCFRWCRYWEEKFIQPRSIVPKNM